LYPIAQANDAAMRARNGVCVPRVIAEVRRDHFGLVPSVPCVGLSGTSWDP